MPSGRARSKGQRGLIVPRTCWDLRWSFPRCWDYWYKIGVSHPRTYNFFFFRQSSLLSPRLMSRGSDVNWARVFLQTFQRHVISPIMAHMGHSRGTWQGMYSPVGHYPNDLASILCQPRILDSQTRNTEWALCHSMVAGVLPRACGNDCHLGSVDLVSSLILVSFIRQRALLWASKRVTHTVQLSIIICFHSLWPQRGMAVFDLSVCNVRVADRWLAH